jgi:hypothetical protein
MSADDTKSHNEKQSPSFRPWWYGSKKAEKYALQDQLKQELQRGEAITVPLVRDDGRPTAAGWYLIRVRGELEQQYNALPPEQAEARRDIQAAVLRLHGLMSRANKALKRRTTHAGGAQ